MANLIHPFDNRDVIAGRTVGLEIAEDCPPPG
jgi:threonine dehydratase